MIMIRYGVTGARRNRLPLIVILIIDIQGTNSIN